MSLKSLSMAAVAALALAAPAFAESMIKIDDPYMRVSTKMSKSGAAFMVIENHGDEADQGQHDSVGQRHHHHAPVGQPDQRRQRGGQQEQERCPSSPSGRRFILDADSFAETFAATAMTAKLDPGPALGAGHRRGARGRLPHRAGRTPHPLTFSR